MHFMTLVIKNFVAVDCNSLPVSAVSLVSRTRNVLKADWWIRPDWIRGSAGYIRTVVAYRSSQSPLSARERETFAAPPTPDTSCASIISFSVRLACMRAGHWHEGVSAVIPGNVKACRLNIHVLVSPVILKDILVSKLTVASHT